MKTRCQSITEMVTVSHTHTNHGIYDLFYQVYDMFLKDTNLMVATTYVGSSSRYHFRPRRLCSDVGAWLLLLVEALVQRQLTFVPQQSNRTP
jgi:hypothetical protein